MDRYRGEEFHLEGIAGLQAESYTGSGCRCTKEGVGAIAQEMWVGTNRLEGRGDSLYLVGRWEL